VIAKAAGIANVDFYLFPSISQDPATQVKNTIQKLQNPVRRCSTST